MQEEKQNDAKHILSSTIRGKTLTFSEYQARSRQSTKQNATSTTPFQSDSQESTSEFIILKEQQTSSHFNPQSNINNQRSVNYERLEQIKQELAKVQINENTNNNSYSDSNLR